MVVSMFPNIHHLIFIKNIFKKLGRLASKTGGHENSRKLKRMIFENFHVPGVMKIKKNLKCILFVDFHVSGVMKNHEN